MRNSIVALTEYTEKPTRVIGLSTWYGYCLREDRLPNLVRCPPNSYPASCMPTIDAHHQTRKPSRLELTLQPHNTALRLDGGLLNPRNRWRRACGWCLKTTAQLVVVALCLSQFSSELVTEISFQTSQKFATRLEGPCKGLPPEVN